MTTADREETALRHLRVGWSCLLIFVLMGAVLEGLHGFKIGFYLSLDNEARRELWTLAHAHGTLLGLVNIAFAATIVARADAAPSLLRAASPALSAATLLLPLGFFAGGLGAVGGDPGAAILLVPAGAVALVVAVAICAVIVLRARATS